VELYSTPRIFFHGTAEGHFTSTEVHINFILQRSLNAAVRLRKPLPYDSIKNWPYLPLCFVVRLALYTLTIWPAHEITLTVKKACRSSSSRIASPQFHKLRSRALHCDHS